MHDEWCDRGACWKVYPWCMLGRVTQLYAGRCIPGACCEYLGVCWEMRPGCMQESVPLLHDGWSCPQQVHAGIVTLVYDSGSELSLDYPGSVRWQHF